MMFRKCISLTEQTVDGAVALACLATLCCSSLGFAYAGFCWRFCGHCFAFVSSPIIACHEFVERITPNGSLGYPVASCLEVSPGGTTVADSWMLCSSALSHPSWFVLTGCWYPNNEDEKCPRPISEQVHLPFCPINFPFPLPLVGGELEGRLKYLKTLIRVGLKKSKRARC